jgi:diguanylate cyclase (GGDEF)-like protein
VSRPVSVVLPAGVAVAGWLAGRRSVRAQLAAATRAAGVDPLTGVANRSGLAAEVAGLPPAPAWLGVVLVDLDGFKPVNDTYGHAAGDAVLVEAAGRLAGVGPTARLGGDEFAVLLGGLPADELASRYALAAAERAFGALAVPYEVAGVGQLRVGASVGAAATPAGRSVAEALPAALAAADLAMYGAKRAGGGVRLAPSVGEPAIRAEDVVPAQCRPAPRGSAGRLRDLTPASRVGGVR